MAGISPKSPPAHSEGRVAVSQVSLNVSRSCSPLRVADSRWPRLIQQVPPPTHLKCLCTLTLTPHCWVVKAVSPVFYERREESPWKPQSVCHRQHPEDGQLVQHLANETKSHVEVRGEKTCDKINDSQTACSSVNGIFSLRSNMQSTSKL